jgi:hypothetical protein
MHRSAKCGLIAAVAISCAFPSESADACGNGVEFRVNPAIQLAAQVERQAQEGAPVLALQAIARQQPLEGRRLGGDGVTDRLFRVAARSVVRLDGDVPVLISQAGELPDDPSAARDKELHWATHVLRHFAIAAPDDPVAATDLGEALARTDKGAAEAMRILTVLEDRDILATAHGYAALARLRARAGETHPGYLAGPIRAFHAGPIDLELERCRSMSKVADLCSPPTRSPLPGTGS